MAESKKATNLRPGEFPEPRAFPSISKPKVVGRFSVNKCRRFIDDASNCKYVVQPNRSERVRFDLNRGYENVIHKIDEAKDEKLDHLLTFISVNLPRLLNERTHEASKKLLSADVVCFRGLLRLLMCTPYENREGWIILATKFRGTVYLCAQETEQRQRERQNESHETKRILSYGFKFEQYMMTGIFSIFSAQENQLMFLSLFL